MAACRQIRSEFSERPSLLIILRYGWTLGYSARKISLASSLLKRRRSASLRQNRWPCPRHVHRAMAYCLQPASAAGRGGGGGWGGGGGGGGGGGRPRGGGGARRGGGRGGGGAGGGGRARK